MALPQHIEDLLKRSEQLNVEYKEMITDGLREDIMAFANKYGGHILIGVSENINPDGSQQGNPIGFKSRNIDEDKRKLDDWARNLRPLVTLSANEEFQLPDGRWLLHVEVQENKEKPVGTQAGLYKIRTNTGNNPIDSTTMRSIIFGEERTLKILRGCLQRNIGHADGILESLRVGGLPLTVFEKTEIVFALSNPDIFGEAGLRDLLAIYQAYEIVDRLVPISITWEPIGSAFGSRFGTFGTRIPEVAGLIRVHSQDAKDRSERLISLIDKMLAQFSGGKS